MEIYNQLEDKYSNILDNPKKLARYVFNPLFALTIWNYGIHDTEIYRQAITEINSENVLAADFSEYNPYNGRYDLGWPDQRLPINKSLLTIKSLLSSPNNNPSQLRIIKHYKCPWKIGDILVYRDAVSNSFRAFVKVKETEIYPAQRNAQVLFLDWESHELPQDKDYFDNVCFLKDKKFMHNATHILTTIVVESQNNKYINKIKQFSTLNEKRLQELQFSEQKTNIYVANRALTFDCIASINY
jgi:hypothetical protein